MDTNSLHNVLEDDFYSLFRYTYNLQYFMGSCRVNIKNNTVAAPTFREKCFTVLCIVLTIGSSYVTVPVIIGLIPDTSVSILGLSVLCSIYTASFSNVVHVRFVNGHQNADFLLKMQKLGSLIKADKRKALNATLKKINSTTVVLIVITFFAITVAGVINFKIQGFALIGWTMYLLSFILEIISCSGIVIYFFVRVLFVNFMIETYLNSKENIRKPVILSGPSSCMVRFAAEDTNNYFATSDISNHLKEIFSCFAMFQNLYRFQLFLFCIKLVVISLMSFEMILYLLSSNENMTFRLSQLAIQIIFIIIDIFMAAFLAYRFGLFFSEVKKTKRLCIAVMAINHDGPLREKAKTMLNIIEETPPRFSIYDMWDMNAGIFMSIFSLVTSIIVTLIQFAFL